MIRLATFKRNQGHQRILRFASDKFQHQSEHETTKISSIRLKMNRRGGVNRNSEGQT